METSASSATNLDWDFVNTEEDLIAPVTNPGTVTWEQTKTASVTSSEKRMREASPEPREETPVQEYEQMFFRVLTLSDPFPELDNVTNPTYVECCVVAATPQATKITPEIATNRESRRQALTLYSSMSMEERSIICYKALLRVAGSLEAVQFMIGHSE